MVKLALASGVAVASLVSLSSDSVAQCANCGTMAGSYDPGTSYTGGGHHGWAAGFDAGGYDQGLGRGVQPLFDNYLTQGNANQATAGMYPSPIGVPGWVGHTYYTYQPLNPHHYLYHHTDRYHSYYDDGRGLNRTKATYSSPVVRNTVHRVYQGIKLPRQ